MVTAAIWSLRPPAPRHELLLTYFARSDAHDAFELANVAVAASVSVFLQSFCSINVSHLSNWAKNGRSRFKRGLQVLSCQFRCSCRPNPDVLSRSGCSSYLYLNFPLSNSVSCPRACFHHCELRLKFVELFAARTATSWVLLHFVVFRGPPCLHARRTGLCHQTCVPHRS
jgi:hypothetical protein